MVFFNDFNLRGIKNWASRRIRALSKSLQSHGLFVFFRRHRTRFIGITYFGVSVALGWVAFTLSREEAIEYWERTFLPSERVIRFALGSRGLAGASEGYPLQKALRSLPSSLDERGSIWFSAEPIWVAAFLPSAATQASGEDSSSVQARVYCLDCKNFPKNWHPLGLGWRALDKVIDQIDIELRQKKGIKMIAPRKLQRDPREIVY